jgi:phage head maturation protease
LALAREGILAGFSVEFLDRFRNWQRTPEGTVVRRSCELLSVGLTRTPAYTGAQLVAVRSRADFDLPPEVDDEQLERLRTLGVQV